LQYQRKLNDWKAEQKAAAGPPPPKKEEPFRELTKEELGRMPMGEQLAYNRKKMDLRAKEKEEAKKAEDLEKS